MAVLALALVSLLLTSDPSSGDHSSDVSCLSCGEVTSPEQCLTSEQCALDEVCFTREIWDHQGRHAFRLGCESKALCDLATATPLVGRRGSRGAGSEVKRALTACFKCCASDHCNLDLCTEAVGVNKTGQGSHVGPSAQCPPDFIKGPNSCLNFSTTQLSWPNAEAACEKLNASLVKVEDSQEDFFIVERIKTLPTPYSSWSYYTGGYYDRTIDQFLWQDGSLFNYTRWGNHGPDLRYKTLYFMNPANNHNFPNFGWALGTVKGSLGFICEATQKT